MLPAAGELLVQPGQAVNALSVVARAELPGQQKVVGVARQLGVPQIDMAEVLRVEVGEFVQKKTVIAAYKRPGALLEQTVRAPVPGVVTAIGPGWILLEVDHRITEVQAFINGVVTRLVGNKGVIVEANGAVIEAVCGFGGEAYGRLNRVVNSPYESLTAKHIGEDCANTILLGGRTLDEEALYAAAAWKVHGIIVGSFPASLLAVDPPVPVRVVATEGYGDISMSPYTFGLLTSLSRREISIRGHTPPPLGQKSTNPQANQPSIIVATDPLSSRGGFVSLTPIPQPEPVEAGVGNKVRVIQGELLGASGVIDLIPPDAQPLTNGIVAPGAYVKLKSDIHFVPWANLKLIE